MSFSVKFSREERALGEVKIALVGKYTKLEDAYISVLKALKHASLHCNRCLKVVVGVYFAVLVQVYSNSKRMLRRPKRQY